MTGPPHQAAPLGSILTLTFFASVAGGAFWTGIFFVTAQHYGFSPARNLLLAASMGLLYALAARFTGALLRRLERRLSPRAILAATLSIWGLCALVPLLARHAPAVLWTMALVGSVASAVTWPIVESFLTAGRHGPGMRAAIGWFNVVWTPATALSLLLLPLVARIDVLLTLALSGPANVIALAALRWLPARPAAHGAEAAAAAVGREYGALKQAASWLLPLAYLMSATLSPILPHLLARADRDGAVAPSVVAATWMVARFVTLAFMARLQFWHGRWGTLMLGAMALVGGLGLVFLATSLPAITAGLFLFGVGTGITYFAALYYAMAVGHAAVDAGGTFEALIGAGYCLGPVLGLLGQALAGPSAEGRARQMTVMLTWAAAALFVGRAARPYFAARRARQR
jgi:MFS family permease